MRKPLTLLVLVIACYLSACRRADKATVNRTDGAVVSPPAAELPAIAHDAANPPIDCPLRKLDIDPRHLRPFDDVERYIAFLERPDRAVWQKPDKVVAVLGLTGTETLVDVGAGSGYFSFRFAKVFPKGKVVAADTEPEMVRHIHHRAMREGVSNLEAKLIKQGDPAIPPNADVVFLCDVLHHVAHRTAWIAKLTAEMRPGARLAVIEFKKGHLPQGPPDAAKISRAQLLTLFTRAGFVLDSEHVSLLPYQVFLIFRKP